MSGLMACCPAPAFTLTDQLGKAVSLEQLRGSVVVLTFFNSVCNDLCRIMDEEMSGALAELGPSAGRVVYVAVNTDPYVTSVSASSPAVIQADLPKTATSYVLGGSLAQLDRVWKAYGITVNGDPTTGQVAHTDALYFISPTGKVEFKAVPYANETTTGTYSLAKGSIQRWSTGIATYVRKTLGAA